MDEEEQNGQSGGRGGRRGGLGSKVRGVEDKAKEIQKGAKDRSDAHKKKATQKSDKAKNLQGKAEQGGKGATKAGQKATKASKQAAKHTKKAEKMAKVASKAGKVAQAASKLTAILSTVGLILLIIIAIVGILVFIIAGFGLIMKGLQDLVDGFMDYMDALWDGQENNIETTAIAETLGYLEEMEYDLYGYGFVTKENALIDADEEIEKQLTEEFGNEEKLETARKKAELVGMDRNAIEEKGKQENWTEKEIKEAKKWTEEEKQKAKEKIDNKTADIKEDLRDDYGSDSGKVLGYKDGEDFDEAYRYIIPYLVSDNYAKCIKNNNKNFKTAFSSFGGFFNGLFNNGTAWGSGLISIYHEDSVGVRGDAFGNTGAQDVLNVAWAVPFPPLQIASGISNIVSSFEGDVDVTNDGYLVVKGSGKFSHDIMKYKIDGWIGRYGMPLEFLLATHVATMAPDLSLKLATEYSTDVEVLLHESENGVVDSAVKIDGTQITQKEIQDAWDEANGLWTSSEKCALAVLKNTKLESRPRDDDKVPQYKCEGPPEWKELAREETLNTYADNIAGTQIDTKIKGFFNEAGNANVDAKVKVESAEIERLINEIKEEFLTTGEEGSTGGETNNSSNTDNNSTNTNQSKTVTFGYNKNVRNELTMDGQTIKFAENDETGEMTYAEYAKVENGKALWETAAIYLIEKKLGLPEDKLQNNSQLKDWLKKIGENYLNGADTHFDISDSLTITINQETSRHRSVTSRSDTQTYKYKYVGENSHSQYFSVNGTYDGNDWKFKFKVIVEMRQADQYTWRIIFNRKTDDEIPNDMKCSDSENQADEACDNCTKYVKALKDATAEVNNDNLDVYVPYINQVTDHWFRNVYFTKAAIDENNDYAVATDTEYEEKTKERWTKYEMYTDNEGEHYELYVYLKDGNDYKTEFATSGGKYIVCRKEEGKGDYKLNEDGITYSKKKNGDYKLKVKNGNDNVSDYSGAPEGFRVGKKPIQNTDIKTGWTAYEEGESNQEWKTLEINENSPSNLIELKNNLEKVDFEMLYSAKYNTILQKEDGVRGQTNPKTKKLFLDEYYIFDGSIPTARLINQAKKSIWGAAEDKGKDPNDPETFRMIKGKDHEVTWGVGENERISASIDDISGPINLTHDALSAFSILKNMHTLDAEYIYHDFKELIVELNYFDKEDLVEPEDEVMMFPISGLSAAGWPEERYDKGEDFYGTLIHSATDLEALRKQDEIEMIKIAAENGAPEDDEDVSQTSKTDNSKEVTPVNGSGNTSYADDASLTDNQKMILQAAEDIHYHLETNGFSYSLSTLYPTLEKADQGSKTLCCASFVGYVAQALGMDFTMSHGSKDVNENILSKVNGVEKISVNGLQDFKSKLQPGDIVWRPRSGGQGHTQIFVGFDNSGNFLWYNCGSSDSVKGSQPYASDWEINSYQTIYRWTGCELSYNGMQSSGNSSSSSAEEQAEFAGFTGSTEEAPEYVVAPVTGEILKYGTVKRKNKYTGKDDQVGFIKIRLLGSKENKAGQDCTFFGDSKEKVKKADVENEDTTAEKWLDDNYSEEKLKKLGYDYFWTEYNDAGLRRSCFVFRRI